MADWRHFAFLTNRTEPLQLAESGKFMANAARTVIGALAHDLLRWTNLIALPDQTVRTARTIRRRLLSIPARLTRSAGRTILGCPPAGVKSCDVV